jgi:hypothetical protein
MKVSGFTIIRNAVKFDYPIVQAIQSILPLCDEMIVCIGFSEDGTSELIRSIPSDKIRIIPTVWDDSLREGGKVLAVETDKAFDAVAEDSDWAFYIQGDEVIHEKYHPGILEAMEKYKDRPEVEGLLFNYEHFYGNYHYVGDSRTWYRNEIRIIRNDKQIRAYRDAQGFRKNGRKLRVKPLEAWVYHYGWVKNPYFQSAKRESFLKMYNPDEKVTIHADQLFDYSVVDSLQPFKGTHPEVMKERIGSMDWNFEFDLKKKNFNLRYGFLYWFEKLTGKRLFEYKNYKII